MSDRFVREQSDDFFKIGEILFQRNVVHHRLQDSRVVPFEKNLTDSKSGRLKMAGTDGPIRNSVFPLVKIFIVQFLERKRRLLLDAPFTLYSHGIVKIEY